MTHDPQTTEASAKSCCQLGHSVRIVSSCKALIPGKMEGQMPAKSPIAIIKTVKGSQITLRWNERLDLVLASFMGPRGDTQGVIEGPSPLPLNHPQSEQIRALGGTCCATVGFGKTGTVIALDDAAAASLRSFRAAMVAEGKRREAIDTERRWRAAAASCPAGHVPAVVGWVNSDLMSAQYVTRDGVEVVAGDLLERHDGFVWLSATAVAEARAERDRRTDRREELRKQLLATVVPTEAHVAYDRYQGSSDRAWDVDDEQAWYLIRRYGDAIEYQAEGAAWRGLRLPR